MQIPEKDKHTEGIIFEAATRVFIEKGMDGARMQEIADRAGINKALLHYYFRSKERLFSAVFEKIAGQMFSKFAPVMDEYLSFEEKIRFFFREHMEILKNNPGLPGFILNEINRNPDRMANLIKGYDVKSIWLHLQKLHGAEFEKYGITKENFPQLITSVVSLSVFPFAAKAIFSVILENMGCHFDDYIEQRKTFAAGFVISALQSGNHDMPRYS